MGLLDKFAQKRYEQRIDKNIKRAKELMAAGKYQESHALLKDMALEMDEDEERYDVVIDLQVECEQAIDNARVETQYHKGMSCYMRKEYAEAQEYFHLPAERGHAGAQYQLGLMYGMGRGVEKDLEKAVALMQKAAAGGVKEAPEVLAMMQGQWAEAGGPQPTAPAAKPTPKPESAKTGADAETRRRAQEAYKRGEAFYRAEDYFAAADSYRVAAELGHAGAQLTLATMYGSSDSSYIPTDLNEAEKWAQKAAENGHELAPSWLENIREQKKTYEPNPEIYCMRGMGCAAEEDYASAFKWFRAAVDFGDTTSLLLLGTLYGGGLGVEQDLSKAEKLARQALDAGVEGAAELLSQIRKARGEATAPATKPEKTTDAERARRSFEAGLSAYEKGNYDSAAKYFREVAEAGYAAAQYNLGLMYLKGEGVVQSKAEAAKWYRKAAEQGNAGAQLDLGLMYSQGIGVTQDKAEAAKWYRKASEQGLAEAQFNLGLMYDNGEGVAQNRVEAVKWYRKASEQGYAGAQNNLAGMYCYGVGVPQDLDEAERWAKRAAASGDENAAKLLEVIRKLR